MVAYDPATLDQAALCRSHQQSLCVCPRPALLGESPFSALACSRWRASEPTSQTLSLLCSWSPSVQDAVLEVGSSTIGYQQSQVWRGVADGQLLAGSSHGRQNKGSPCSLFYKVTNLIPESSAHMTLSSSKEHRRPPATAHLLIPNPSGLGFHRVHVRDTSIQAIMLFLLRRVIACVFQVLLAACLCLSLSRYKPDRAGIIDPP